MTIIYNNINTLFGIEVGCMGLSTLHTMCRTVINCTDIWMRCKHIAYDGDYRPCLRNMISTA